MHKELKGWLEWLGMEEPLELSKIYGDEESRRYYRIEKKEKKLLVMDASDVKESVPIFIGISWRLGDTKIRIPQIRAYELNKGFILLEDLGSTHLYDKCSSANPSAYYQKAIKTLVQMQETPSKGLDPYDMGFLIEEMNLMLEWYYKSHLGKTLECVEGQQLIQTFISIAQEVLAQPQETFVHHDYHSKNLMIDEVDDIVVMDFQDAREGSIVYDLASLLYDPYVALDKRERKRFIKLFKTLKGVEVDDETFMRWVEFTAVQRCLTQLGTFSKLSREEKKTAYLDHTPLLCQYILDIALKYSELEILVHMLTSEEQDSIGFTLCE